uniref:Uncharacterized protein n=1 Tax=Bracon brevicornis TaxID=1563983 RepID=A0A6V7JQ65_9HYME
MRKTLIPMRTSRDTMQRTLVSQIGGGDIECLMRVYNHHRYRQIMFKSGWRENCDFRRREEIPSILDPSEFSRSGYQRLLENMRYRQRDVDFEDDLADATAEEQAEEEENNMDIVWDMELDVDGIEWLLW